MSAVLQSTEAETQEWQLRCDMAAVFRIAARFGWNEQIGNHNSVMLRGDRPRFLINPRGYLFQELTASSLIVCDLDGRVRGKGELRKVAYQIHARIHVQNPHATCILHVHPHWLTALSTGSPLRKFPESSRRNFTGPWGERIDARMHLDAWRRRLDCEEPDYAT